MTEIINDLYQFTDVLEPIKLSVHQYLLMTEEPILIQTGAVPQAQATLPKIKKLLGDKSIKYILISHFESDECGGIKHILEEYPHAVCVCSEVTARQLWGFDLAHNVEVKKPGELFTGSDFKFAVIAYPSEMHMWEGVLFFEEKRGIFFSSDLMFGMGENHGQVIKCSWEEAIKTSGVDTLPNKDLQSKLISDLKAISPQFVASGHGFCIEIVG